jgi:hypothetical protein
VKLKEELPGRFLTFKYTDAKDSLNNLFAFAALMRPSDKAASAPGIDRKP